MERIRASKLLIAWDVARVVLLLALSLIAFSDGWLALRILGSMAWSELMSPAWLTNGFTFSQTKWIICILGSIFSIQLWSITYLDAKRWPRVRNHLPMLFNQIPEDSCKNGWARNLPYICLAMVFLGTNIYMGLAYAALKSIEKWRVFAIVVACSVFKNLCFVSVFGLLVRYGHFQQKYFQVVTIALYIVVIAILGRKKYTQMIQDKMHRQKRFSSAFELNLTRR